MNEDNLLFFATDMAEGIEPGSFWFTLLNLINQPPVDGSYLGERFDRLVDLFNRADARNAILLRAALPGAHHTLKQFKNEEIDRDEAIERLTRILKLLPFLLMRFIPLSRLIDDIADSLGREWHAGLSEQESKLDPGDEG